MARLIVTNGDSAAANIRSGGVSGRVLEWRDVLHDGPVPGLESLELVSDVRADYLAAVFGLDFADVRGDFAARDGLITAHIAYSDVELWFEHDLFDQLQLVQLLAFFAREPERVGLKLMQADTYLGALSHEAAAALAPGAVPVTTVQLEAGRATWAAVTADTPEGIAALAEAPVPDLPFLAPSLRRWLEELPAPASGLSLTQERALQALAEGPMIVGRLFGAVTEQDEAKFLGDMSFFLRLDEMAFGPEPLLTGLPCPVHEVPRFSPAVAGEVPTAEELSYRSYAARTVTLTPAGRAALAGTLDHATANAIDRWQGGTHLKAGNIWRFDRRQGRLVAPA